MPNFQGAVNRISTTLMGAAVAMPMAEEKYAAKQIGKAMNYAEGQKELVEGAIQAGAVNENISRLGKYVPAAYQQSFKEAISPIKSDVIMASQENSKRARSEAAAEAIPTSLQEQWSREIDAQQRAMIARRQASVNKSKAAKLLPRDSLMQMYTDYVQKEENKDGE